MYGTVVPFVGIVPSIPCEKDLEDYTRLWTSGISNVMAVDKFDSRAAKHPQPANA